MPLRFFLALVAVAGITLAVYKVLPYEASLASGRPALRSKTPPPARPLQPPPERPAKFQATLHGMGLIEAERENIPIGVSVAGLVLEVYVDGRPGFDPPHKRVGDRVAKDDPLFRIDGRDLEAELKVHEASLAAAEAQLHRLERLPRPEDLPPAQAAVEEMEARLLDAEAAYNRSTQLYQRNMLAASEYDRDRFARLSAKAALDRAKADLEKLQAGAWQEDVEVQRAAVLQARSQVERTRRLHDRLIVRAPMDGVVLQVNVRPGQFATQVWNEPMIVLGETDRLHVRVDIDENDLPRFREGVPGVSTLKGRTQPEFPLTFVRVEPYVIPKRSLTGDNAERVDTRVLQVIYALPETPPTHVYVGQQMDVFLDLSEGS